MLLFSPIGVVFFIIIGLFFYILILRIINRHSSSNHGRNVILSSVAYLLFIIASWQALMTDFDSPSTVIIAPLSQIIAKQFYDEKKVEEKFNQLKDNNCIYGFESFECIGINVKGRKWIIRYSMNNMREKRTISMASVSLHFFESSEYSMIDFNNEKELLEKRKVKKRGVEVSDNVDVILCHSVLDRDAHLFSIYRGDSSLETIIRLGSVVISINEFESEYREIGALTSKIIELICQAFE